MLFAYTNATLLLKWSKERSDVSQDPTQARLPAMALLRGGGGREKREKEKGGGKKKKGGKGKKINSVSLYVS